MSRSRVSLSCLLSVLMVLALLPAAGAAAQQDEPQVLVFSATAGFRHGSIEAGVAALEALGDEHDFAVDATEDAEAFTDENLVGYDAVVWLSTTGDVLDADQQAAFERYVQGGGGYVGIHAASDTHYDWGWYGGLVGAYFESHPPGTQTADVMVYDAVHPSTQMLPAVWERHDEWYDFNLNPRGDVHVLAGLDESSYADDVDPGPQMGWDHPIAWCQPYDGGRSWYTAGGHTEASFAEELFLEHLAGGILWAAGAVAGDCAATIWDSFEKETLAQGRDVVGEPMGLAVLPDGRVLHTSRADGPSDPRVTPVNPVNGLGHVHLTDPDAGETVEVAEIPVYRFSEYGVQGIALDPDFEDNGWVYLYYTPEVPGISEGEAPRNSDDPSVWDEFDGVANLSRFQFVDDGDPQLDLDSEQVLLEVPQNLGLCCHVAGDIDFDSQGNLYLSTGDNTHFQDSDNYAPINDVETRNPGFDARRTSGNTNHLAGKLLRITPQEDGSYTVPEGNMFNSGAYDDLFPDGEYDESLARPEIYAMGLRNPFRFSIDRETDAVYLGDYGPDAGQPNPDRGPQNTVSWHVITEPVNIGWPYCIGNNFAYNAFDFATGTSGDPFDCEGGPTNDSRHNTGLEQLPPVTPATIWYHYQLTPEFPQLGTGGGGPMGGPAYHYDPDVAAASNVAWPEYYDGIPLLYEYTRNWVKQIHLDDDLDLVDITETVPNIGLNSPMDMEFGPDGALYVVEYSGPGFNPTNGAVSRILYHGEDGPPPTPSFIGDLECIGAISDDFERGKLDGDRWSIVRENADGYRVADGALHIDTGDGLDMWTNNATAENLALQPAPHGVWQITTEVDLELSASHENEQAGLMVYGDDANFAKLVFIQKEDGRRFEFATVEDGTAVWNPDLDASDFLDASHGSTVHLRIESDGSNLTASWSSDGAEFTEFGRERSLSPITNPQVGVAAFNGGGTGNEASFEHFTLVYDEGELEDTRSDDFEGDELDLDRWSIIREDPDGYRVADGALHIDTGNGLDMWTNNATAQNLVLQPAPQGAWQLTTEVDIDLDTGLEHEQAGLMVYGNDANFAKLVFISKAEGPRFEFATVENGTAVWNANLDATDHLDASFGSTAHLRIESDGSTLTASWSSDGVEFTEFGRERSLSPFTNPQVGVAAFNGGGTGTEASFEHVTLDYDPAAQIFSHVDDFDHGDVDLDRWNIIRRNVEGYQVADGALHIDTGDGTDMHGSNTTAQNVVVQPAPAGAWRVTTEVDITHDPGHLHEQAGLMVYGNDANFAKLMFIQKPEGRNFEFATTEGGSAVFDANLDTTPFLDAGYGTTAHLRIESDGSRLTASWSPDGVAFTEFGRTRSLAPIPDPQVGLAAYNGNGAGNEASFAHFTLTPDPGALADTRSDDFEGDELDGCRWDRVTRHNPDKVSMSGGQLHLDVPSGDIYQATNTNPDNFILQTAPEGDFVIETSFDAPFEEQYQQAGLIVYDDQANWVKLNVVTDNPPGADRQLRVELRSEIGDQIVGPTPQISPAPANPDDQWWLRLAREGTTYTGWVSVDGENWIELDDQVENDALIYPGMGIYTLGHEQTDSVTVSFDYFASDPDEFIRPSPPGEPDLECGEPVIEDGYTALWDGESLDGWTQAGPGRFDIVEDAARDGTCALETVGGMGLLWHEDELGSYRFRTDFKPAVSEANSGIFVGFPDPGTDPWVAVDHGYEIQIDDYGAGNPPGQDINRTGAIYSFQEPTSFPTVMGEWNTYEIEVDDPFIRVWINGELVNEFEDPDGSGRDLSSGYLGLQNHGSSTGLVQFRDVQVIDLDDVVDDLTVEIELDPTDPDGEDDWYVSPVTMTLSSQRGDAALQWRFAGDDAWVDYTGPVTFDEDGVAEVEARAIVPGEGDSDAPDEVHVTVGDNGNVYNPSDITVAQGGTITYELIDGFHDVVTEDANGNVIDASELGTDWGTHEFTATQAGTFTIYCTPHVSAGMVGTVTVEPAGADDEISEIESVSFALDQTVPETSAQLAGETLGEAFVGEVELTLEASDATSGVAETHLRLAGDEEHDLYVDPVTFTGVGSYTVELRSVDVAGNVEDWQTITFEIVDEVPPPGELELELAASTRCVAGNVFVTVTARNDNEVPVDVELVTEYGSRAFVGVVPGRFASLASNTRAATLGDGSVTVRADAVIDGDEVSGEWTMDFAGLSC